MFHCCQWHFLWIINEDFWEAWFVDLKSICTLHLHSPLQSVKPEQGNCADSRLSLVQTYPVVILRTVHPGDQLLLRLRVDLHHEAPLLGAVVVPVPPGDRLRGTVVAGGPSLGPVWARAPQETSKKELKQDWQEHLWRSLPRWLEVTLSAALVSLCTHCWMESTTKEIRLAWHPFLSYFDNKHKVSRRSVKRAALTTQSSALEAFLAPKGQSILFEGQTGWI